MLLLLLTAHFALFQGVLFQVVGTQTVPSGTLIWADEFDTLNTSTWKHLITSWRGEFAVVRANSSTTPIAQITDGILHIVPTLTADRYGNAFLYNGTLNLTAQGCNFIGPENFNSSCVRKGGLNGDIINPIQSARLITNSSFSFTYGRVEIRAKMSRGDWIWPSAWLSPTDNYYGTWPTSGEIDMVEIHGNDKFVCDGIDMGNKVANSTLHWSATPGSNKDKYFKTRWNRTLTSGTFASDFHLYGMIWSPSGINFTIDNVTIGSIPAPVGGFYKYGKFSADTPNPWVNGTTMAPFDQRFHFILKVAVGGDFFPDRCINYDSAENIVPKPWSTKATVQMRPFWENKTQWYPTWTRNPEDSHMLVDYIRVYSL